MTTIILAIVMAIIVEAMIEYVKTIVGAVEKGEYKTAVTQVCAIALAVLLCFAAGADIFAALGIDFSMAWIGTLLTGIFASRGANYVSDIVKKIQGAIGGTDAVTNITNITNKK